MQLRRHLLFYYSFGLTNSNLTGLVAALSCVLFSGYFPREIIILLKNNLGSASKVARTEIENHLPAGLITPHF